MRSNSQNPQSGSSSGKEIFIAAMGVVGVIVTGLFSNWDKIFPQENVVTSVYSGYQPSGNAEQEVKYLNFITGAESNMVQVQNQIVAMQKQQLSELFKDDPKMLDGVYAIMDEELQKYNKKVVDAGVKIQSQYFTIQEIQELNKFYSTPVMKEFIRRQPAVTQSFMNEIQPLVVELQQSIEKRVKNELLDKAEGSPKE